MNDCMDIIQAMYLNSLFNEVSIYYHEVFHILKVINLIHFLYNIYAGPMQVPEMLICFLLEFSEVLEVVLNEIECNLLICMRY